jgi:hypothetical protein
MTQRGIIFAESDQRCELCGEIEECRPYGPKGEQVCFNCGHKDQSAMERGFRRHVLGEDNA